MSPRKTKGKQLINSNKSDKKSIKRFIKFLSVCQNPRISKEVIKGSPDIIIKRICDAALNAHSGEVAIPKRSKQKFHAKRKLIEKLIDNKIPISAKRRYISNQRGGALSFLPLLLSTVIGSLGSTLFNK